MQDRKMRLQQFDDYYRTVGQEPKFGRVIRNEVLRMCRFLIPEGSEILDIGCGNGDLLAALKPSRGVGVDSSPTVIERAKSNHSHLEFMEVDAEQYMGFEGAFDFILLNNVIGDFYDVWKLFRNIRKFCRDDTRVVVTYYNHFWEPGLRLASRLGLRKQTWAKNWFALADIQTILALNGFEPIHAGSRLLCPLPIPLIRSLANRFLASLPIFRGFNLLTYSVARILPEEEDRFPKARSVSVVIPCRNEVGTIEETVRRLPFMGASTEIIFVDGASTDGTVEKIKSCIEKYEGIKHIRLIHQIPKDAEASTTRRMGKGDAVRLGFEQARGDVLMILESDLTIPPEELEKFYLAIAEGRAEFINGNRLSYPLERKSMSLLNQLANRITGLCYSWIVGQRVKDTLCGTKVLTREAYRQIKRNRHYFGDFDPFGDFDLLFGAARLNLKIIDLPVHFKSRVYPNERIARFKHVVILLKMLWFALRRLKLQ